MEDKPKSDLIRGFLFACTEKSEAECLERSLFATEKIYGPVVIRIRKGDLLFLNNLDTNKLYGVFKAIGDGKPNIEQGAFGGRYPYQVKVEAIGEIVPLTDAKKILKGMKIGRNTPILKGKLVTLLKHFLSTQKQAELPIFTPRVTSNDLIQELIESILNDQQPMDIEEEIPIVESTTFWDFPRQSYGLTPKGNNKYAGVTPALIIYNMVWRYTEPGDFIVDPMCGSGTTLDVCKAEKRRAIGYDISSARPDIIQNDARHIPLEDSSVDMVFIDSPYGDNIKYNDHPDNIGRISSESEEFYDELEKSMKESHRILKEGKVIGWLIGDQWVRHKFTPVGFKIYDRLCKYFEPMEIICVARRGQSSNTDAWHNRARRFNFYLRGFKYLIIMRKASKVSRRDRPRKVEWAYYKRG
ncbi:MAG: DNA methylase [Deltaproteobacteria bacterium]|nr:DNA methylase [Deltaproteobacteria bacterium]MBW2341168.1 DNA methylase [Deltaproteobacteria bacterium]